jgi:hypothetical protein
MAIYNQTTSDDKILIFLDYIIAFVATAFEGVSRMKKFLLSSQIYGPSPFIWPTFGFSELSQLFSRLSAVYGGTTMLNARLMEEPKVNRIFNQRIEDGFNEKIDEACNDRIESDFNGKTDIVCNDKIEGHFDEKPDTACNDRIILDFSNGISVSAKYIFKTEFTTKKDNKSSETNWQRAVIILNRKDEESLSLSYPRYYIIPPRTITKENDSKYIDAKDEINNTDEHTVYCLQVAADDKYCMINVINT